jgi:hypothetical protein
MQFFSKRGYALGSEFASFIGSSREAVRAKHQRHEVLGLTGGKRGLRFPKWQVNSSGTEIDNTPAAFLLPNHFGMEKG